MTESHLNHFLVISGHISGNKKKEFEQTFRLAFGSLSEDCLEYCLSVDTNKEGDYHFFSVWSNENAMKSFLNSMEFQLMNGAFHALGSIKKTMNGSVYENHRYYSGK
ncbi:MAG: antibiotic biosynthesis monooxygenase [Puia sp.]